jgi:hypothetical protein
VVEHSHADDLSSGSSQALPDTQAAPKTVVCCSGGGIRSASFNLGALQALTDDDRLVEASELIGVSGGAYIAASRSMVDSALPEHPSQGPYASGSAEENRLRDNTRYLLPDGATAVRGALYLVLGLAFNLALLLAPAFVVGHLLGWLFHSTHVLVGLRVGEPRFIARWWTWLIPAVLGGLTILAFLWPLPWPAPRRTPDPVDWDTKKTRIVWVLSVAAVVAALAFLATPRAIQGLYDVGLHDGGNLGTVVRGSGFATAEGCKSAAAREWSTGSTETATAGSDQTASKICGAAIVSAQPASVAKDQASSNAPKDTKGQSGGFVAFFVALVALVRGALGRLRGTKPSATGSSTKAASDGDSVASIGQKPSITSRIGTTLSRVVLPWIGSALVVGVLACAFLRWTADGAITGLADASATELWLVAGAAGFMIVSRLFTDINRTSMHHFYRDRLAYAFAVERLEEAGTTSAVAHPERLASDIVNAQPGLVVCAAANVSAVGDAPPGRAAVSFTFSPHQVVLSAGVPPHTAAPQAAVTGRASIQVPTKEYETVVGGDHHPCGFNLFDAVAISGAAVSPLMGKMTRQAQRILLTVANVRLGIWLPSPRLFPSADPTTDRRTLKLGDRCMQSIIKRRANATSTGGKLFTTILWRASQPNLRLLLAEAIGHNRVRESWLYVSDGGHYDNLGLVEAFRRGATTIYAFDASGDSVTTWNTLGEAIALARSECGVEVMINPKADMVKDGTLVRPWTEGTFAYTWDEHTPHREGTLYLCKLGVWERAPWDVQAYATRHPTFPTDSTLQQLYDDEEFEAYRALGHAAATEMLEAIRQEEKQTKKNQKKMMMSPSVMPSESSATR